MDGCVPLYLFPSRYAFTAFTVFLGSLPQLNIQLLSIRSSDKIFSAFIILPVLTRSSTPPCLHCVFHMAIVSHCCTLILTFSLRIEKKSNQKNSNVDFSLHWFSVQLLGMLAYLSLCSLFHLLNNSFFHASTEAVSDGFSEPQLDQTERPGSLMYFFLSYFMTLIWY